MKLDQPDTCTEAYVQLMLIERLNDVIVRPRFHTLDQILAQALGGEQQDVRVWFLSTLAHTAADFETGHPRHHPIEYGERGRVRRAENLARAIAVGGENHFIAPLPYRGVEQVPGYDTVVCNKYLHVLNRYSQSRQPNDGAFRHEHYFLIVGMLETL